MTKINSILFMLFVITVLPVLGQNYQNLTIDGSYSLGSQEVKELFSKGVQTSTSNYNLVLALTINKLYLFKDGFQNERVITQGPIDSASITSYGSGNCLLVEQINNNFYCFVGTSGGLLCYQLSLDNSTLTQRLINGNLLYIPDEIDPQIYLLAIAKNTNNVQYLISTSQSSNSNFAYQSLSIMNSNVMLGERNSGLYGYNGGISALIGNPPEDLTPRIIVGTGFHSGGTRHGTFLTKYWGDDQSWEAIGHHVTRNGFITSSWAEHPSNNERQKLLSTRLNSVLSIYNTTINSNTNQPVYQYNCAPYAIRDLSLYQYNTYTDYNILLALSGTGVNYVNLMRKVRNLPRRIYVEPTICGFVNGNGFEDVKFVATPDNQVNRFFYSINHTDGVWSVNKSGKHYAKLEFPELGYVDGMFVQYGTYGISWNTGNHTILDQANVRLEINYDYPNGSWNTLFNSRDITLGERTILGRPQTYIRLMESGANCRIRMYNVNDPNLHYSLSDEFQVLPTPPSEDPPTPHQVFDGQHLITRPVIIEPNDSLIVTASAILEFQDSGKIVVSDGAKLIIEGGGYLSQSIYRQWEGDTTILVKQYATFVDVNQDSLQSTAIEVQSGGKVIGKHAVFSCLESGIKVNGGQVELDSVEFVDCGTAMDVAVLSDTVSLSNSTISGGSDGVTVYGHGELL